MLLRTNTVHGRGLRCPLVLIGLTSSGVVAVQRHLGPGEFARIREAKWILELPAEDAIPEVGAQLRIYARLCDWEIDSVCNSNRQPRRLV